MLAFVALTYLCVRLTVGTLLDAVQADVVNLATVLCVVWCSRRLVTVAMRLSPAFMLLVRQLLVGTILLALGLWTTWLFRLALVLLMAALVRCVTSLRLILLVWLRSTLSVLLRSLVRLGTGGIGSTACRERYPVPLVNSFPLLALLNVTMRR